MRKEKYIVVIGGLGFIGTPLINKLLNYNYNVINIDCNLTNSEPIKRSSLRNIITENWLESVNAVNYCINNFNNDNNKIIAIIDLSFVDSNSDNYNFKLLDYYYSFSFELFKIATKNGLPVIKTFNPFLFNNDGEYINYQLGTDNLCEILEKNIYNMGYELYRFFPNFKFTPVILYDVYDLKSDKDKSYISKIYKCVKNNTELDLSNISDKSTCDFIHLDDVINGFIKIIELNGFGKTYGFGTGIETNIYKLAESYLTHIKYSNQDDINKCCRRLPIDEFNNDFIRFKYSINLKDSLSKIASLKKS